MAAARGLMVFNSGMLRLGSLANRGRVSADGSCDVSHGGGGALSGSRSADISYSIRDHNPLYTASLLP